VNFYIILYFKLIINTDDFINESLIFFYFDLFPASLISKDKLDVAVIQSGVFFLNSKQFFLIDALILMSLNQNFSIMNSMILDFIFILCFQFF